MRRFCVLLAVLLAGVWGSPSLAQASKAEAIQLPGATAIRFGNAIEVRHHGDPSVPWPEIPLQEWINRDGITQLRLQQGQYSVVLTRPLQFPPHFCLEGGATRIAIERKPGSWREADRRSAYGEAQDAWLHAPLLDLVGAQGLVMRDVTWNMRGAPVGAGVVCARKEAESLGVRFDNVTFTEDNSTNPVQGPVVLWAAAEACVWTAVNVSSFGGGDGLVFRNDVPDALRNARPNRGNTMLTFDAYGCTVRNHGSAAEGAGAALAFEMDAPGHIGDINWVGGNLSCKGGLEAAIEVRVGSGFEGGQIEFSWREVRAELDKITVAAIRSVNNGTVVPEITLTGTVNKPRGVAEFKAAGSLARRRKPTSQALLTLCGRGLTEIDAVFWVECDRGVQLLPSRKEKQ